MPNAVAAPMNLAFRRIPTRASSRAVEKYVLSHTCQGTFPAGPTASVLPTWQSYKTLTAKKGSEKQVLWGQLAKNSFLYSFCILVPQIFNKTMSCFVHLNFVKRLNFVKCERGQPMCIRHGLHKSQLIYVERAKQKAKFFKRISHTTASWNNSYCSNNKPEFQDGGNSPHSKSQEQ